MIYIINVVIFIMLIML